MREYPGIQLDIAVIKMPTDIVSEGFDAGVRLGEQIDHDMITIRVIGDARFLVVASPDYLKRYPRPRTPGDLRHHDCIRNRLPNGAIFGWDFEKNGKTRRAAVEGRLIVNDIELSIRAVRDGLGLGCICCTIILPPISKRAVLSRYLRNGRRACRGFFFITRVVDR